MARRLNRKSVRIGDMVLHVTPEVHEKLTKLMKEQGKTAAEVLSDLLINHHETNVESTNQPEPAPRYKPVCIWNYADWKADKDEYGNVTKWNADYNCPIRLQEPIVTTEALAKTYCKLCFRYIKVKTRAKKHKNVQQGTRTSTYGGLSADDWDRAIWR